MADGRPRKQEQEDADPAITEPAPGVLRLQLPISMPGLGHVNCYVLEDSKGLAVVDPGLPGPASWKALKERMASGGLPLERVHTVFVTHSHPDHYGGAGKLASESGADLVTHADFQSWWARPAHSHADATDSDDGHEHEHEQAAPSGPMWSRPTPWGGKPFRPPMKRRMMYRLFANRARSGWSPPEPTRTVIDGETLSLAGREWVAVHTPGHTLDHLCLHDPAAGILLSGDHVLPTITPHISGLGTGKDPLANYLSSLDAVAALPDVQQVLPAHGHPFGDLPGRVDAIKAHHQERLEKLASASKEIGGFASVTDLSHHLFRERSWGSMAESETFAHLEHLRLAGRAERRQVGEELHYLVG